jgi:hypothetical protein
MNRKQKINIMESNFVLRRKESGRLDMPVSVIGGVDPYVPSKCPG